MGVILYELFIGTPPFYANSLYSLIHLIVKDPVKYPTGKPNILQDEFGNEVRIHCTKCK